MFRLAMTLQPARKVSPLSGVASWASVAMARAIATLSVNSRQGHPKKCRAVWNGAGSQDAPMTEARPPGSMKCQVIVPANLPLDAEARIELDQIRATAQQHVLAVVHHFAGAGMLVGRGASAEKGTALKQRHLKSAVGEAQPAASPASPPPTMATLGLCPATGSSRQTLHEALRPER